MRIECTPALFQIPHFLLPGKVLEDEGEHLAGHFKSSGHRYPIAVTGIFQLTGIRLFLKYGRSRRSHMLQGKFRIPGFDRYDRFSETDWYDRYLLTGM